MRGNSLYRKSNKAIVYCRSCSTKITKNDTMCPSCGAPNSLLIPVLMVAVIVAALVLVFVIV